MLLAMTQVGQVLLQDYQGGMLAREEVRVAGGVALGGGEVVLCQLDLAADGLELPAE